MGYYNNTENNITLDAVLTNEGRLRLSLNDGSFNITRFAFSDDECDYTIITKFGRTIGIEKIEKNMLIMQALTADNLEMKYMLFGASNPNLSLLVNWVATAENQIEPPGSNVKVIQLGRTQQRTSNILLEQKIPSVNVIDIELQTTVVEVRMKNDLLAIQGLQPQNILRDGTAIYTVQRSPDVTSQNGGRVNFTLLSRQLTDEDFQFKGNSNDKTKIDASVTVTDAGTGTSTNILVEILSTL